MKTGYRRVVAAVLVMVLFVSISAVSVTAAARKVTLNKTSAEMYILDNVQLRARVNGKTVRAEWSSSNKKVATVSRTGKVYAKSPGQAVITANVGGARRSCRISVISSVSRNVMHWVRGKWYRWSSGYRDNYYRFRNGYFYEYNRRNDRVTHKYKIKAIKKFKYSYAIIINGSGGEFRYLFRIKNGKVTDMTHYWKHDGEWDSYGGDGMTRTDIWR